MIYKIIQPSSHLKTFVKDYSLLHFTFEKNEPTPVKPFPANTQHCLVFYLKGSVTAFNSKSGTPNLFARIAINGSQISRFDFHLSPHFFMLSVNFQPGALSKFLQLPLTEFVDERIDAEAILNPEISNIQECMANANSYEGILLIIETYLWKRIQSLRADFHPIDKVAHLLSENPNSHSVEKLAEYACLSISQFERRFMQQTGITPKLFARINRFSQAYQLKEQKPNLDWLSIALQTGYYDYQHLVKDFKQFSSSTPHSLLEAQTKAPERLFPLL